MELWIIFAILATLLWSVQAIFNKLIRQNYIKHSLAYIIILLPTGFYPFLLLLFESFQLPTLTDILIMLVSGTVTYIAHYLYIESLHYEDASTINIMLAVHPVFVLIIASIFLKETLTGTNLIAFIMILSAAIFASVKPTKKKTISKTGLILIIVASFFFAIKNTTLKAVTQYNLATVMSIATIPFLILTPLILLFSTKQRQNSITLFKQLTKKQKSIVYFSEILGLTAVFLSYLALKTGKVSLVTVIIQSKPILVFMMAIFLSLKLPHLLKEELTKKIITLKIISLLMIIIGIILLTI
jgi:drug/metabolite transporter (DMT)-like permease